MASTPSASALSAVLRCRGNIWTRNSPTKRPATSVYSLGLPGGALRDSPAERSGSNQASAWEAFPQGECVVVGRKLTVSYRSDRVVGKVSRENNKLRYPKLSRPPGDARSAAPAVQNALVRELTGRLPGKDTCSKIIHMINCERYAAHIRKTTFVKDMSEFPVGVLKLSVTSCPCLMGNAGQMPSFVLTGWSSLKITCSSLTALVSKILSLNLGELCSRSSSSPDEAPRHLLCQLDEKTSRSSILQANEQTSSKNDSSSGQKIPQEGPD